MAQSRAKRKQRSRRRAPVVPDRIAPRRTKTRRAVIAFLVLVGLAGILAVSAPGDDGDGAPGAPRMAVESDR